MKREHGFRPSKFHHLFGRWWAITALGLSLLMLASAWSFQIFGHYAPCHLCLKQRDVYWIAVGVAMTSSIWALFTGSKGAPRVFNYVLFAIFLTGAALSFFHAGVEAHWWPGPKTCSSVSGEINFDDMAAFIAGAQIAPPMCDVVAWRLFGLSMAAYNTIISLILAILSLLASVRFHTKRRPTLHK